MNLPTPTRRVFTPEEIAVYTHIRNELRFWTADHRRHRGKAYNTSTAIRVCALHKALNRLRGRADCHVIKINKHGYDEAQAQVLADRLLADARLDVGLPLRCYVVVSGNGVRPGQVPKQSQLFVQAAHALAELMKHYHEHAGIRQWADVDRTLIICQGVSPTLDLQSYCPYGRVWPGCGFADEHYGRTPLAYALWPMTERQAQVLGLTTRALL